MAKSSEKAGAFKENFEFPTFDMTKASEQFRVFAEKSLEQSRDAYAKLKTNAEETQKALETSFETARAVSNDFSLKTISAFRANFEADLSFLEQLAGARTVSEVVELQTSFVRKRAELGVDQAKDFQAAASKAAEELAQPIKSAFDRFAGELKAA